jgi:hypothetical protein
MNRLLQIREQDLIAVDGCHPLAGHMVKRGSAFSNLPDRLWQER